MPRDGGYSGREVPGSYVEPREQVDIRAVGPDRVKPTAKRTKDGPGMPPELGDYSKPAKGGREPRIRSREVT